MAWENSLNDPREQCLQYTHQPLLYIRTKVVLRWKIEWQKNGKESFELWKVPPSSNLKGVSLSSCCLYVKETSERGTSFSTNDPGYVLHRCCITTKVYIHPLPTPVKNWKLKTFFATYFPNRSLSLFCPPLCFEWLTFIVAGIWLEGPKQSE